MSYDEEREWRHNLGVIVTAERRNILRRKPELEDSIREQREDSANGGRTVIGVAIDRDVFDDPNISQHVFVKDDDSDHYLMHAVLDKSKSLGKRHHLRLLHLSCTDGHNIDLIFEYIANKLRPRIPNGFVMDFPEGLSDPLNFQVMDAFETGCKYLVYPTRYTKALVVLSDDKSSKLGVSADIRSLQQMCESNVKLDHVKDNSYLNCNKTSKQELDQLFAGLAEDGINQVITYYSGSGFNNGESPFPSIKMLDCEITQGEIEEMTDKYKFDTFIFGYDCGNCDPKLTTRSGGAPPADDKIHIWDFVGTLYFTGASKGEIAWAMLLSGGVFTNNLVQYLAKHDGNWIAALEDIKASHIKVKADDDMVLNPYFEVY